VAQPSQAAAQGDAPASQPIETIRVGQRVVASVAGKPAAEAAADTQVDPSSWRLLRLRAEDRWADGTLDVVRIETLQGPEWIAAHRATVGARVPLPLDLQEMGLPGSLRAVVTANEPCPPVASGPGRVVLTTVNHLNANVLELTLVDGRGRQERLRPTGSHKFFSEDRQEFVAAEELRQREHLRGAGGRLTLLRAERATGVHRVYNMTVEGEHVYRVSLLGALVHNNCPQSPTIGPKIQSQMGRRGWTAQQIDEAVQGGMQIPAINRATGNPAIRYVHPVTGQSVVVDRVTKEVIHVGGPGFLYGPGAGDVPLLPLLPPGA